MRVLRVLPNLHVDDLDSAKEFYAGFLGLSNELMNLGWVARYASPDGAGQVQLVTRDQTSPEDSNISVQTPDVDEAYAEAQRRGYEIVHPLTDEEWGVHRFLVRAPDGTIVNVVGHTD
ncbi:MAG TPA: VOC family protein [Lapillicoccus sp.]|nr:VOC family protein [Lapillicoccus sp.]